MIFEMILKVATLLRQEEKNSNLFLLHKVTSLKCFIFIQLQNFYPNQDPHNTNALMKENIEVL